MLIIFLFLFVISLGIIALSFGWTWDVMFGGDSAVTNKQTTKRIAEIIIAHGYQNGLLYDLGSCRGNVVFGILETCPNLQIVGIDDSYLRTGVAKFRGYFHKYSPQFLKGNLFNMDISRADVMYVYVPRPMLARVEAKIRQESKPGSIIITSRVNFPTWEPTETYLTNSNDKVESIYIYKNPVLPHGVSKVII